MRWPTSEPPEIHLLTRFLAQLKRRASNYGAFICPPHLLRGSAVVTTSGIFGARLHSTDMNSISTSSTSAITSSGRVCAVVVTFRRPECLCECLSGLQSQTRPVDHILVVDNASGDGTPDLVAREFAGVEVVVLPENGGGAGGFYEGMKRAHEAGFEWIWVMDDDGVPARDCLEQMMAYAAPMTAMVPLQQDSDGRQYGFFLWRGHNVDVTEEIVRAGQARQGAFPFAFVGPLMSRDIIDQVGLPNPEFFIWFDDWEFALRIRLKTRARIVAVPKALFYHDFGGKSVERRFLGRTTRRSAQQPWKTYYETRNQLYTFTRTRKRPRELWFYARNQIKPLIGDILFEPDRFERVRLRFKGVFDGLFGRLGKRVEPTASKK